ncbi:MAG: hypothetical protein ACRC6V_03960 [Bacteroidales bacterium]
MESILRGILEDFISGELSHVDLKMKYSQMQASIQALRRSDSLTKVETKLIKLFHLANEDADLRFDKSFISKI